jgi:hypothetical protein
MILHKVWKVSRVELTVTMGGSGLDGSYALVPHSLVCAVVLCRAADYE